MISFNVTKEEAELIILIAKRAQAEIFDPKGMEQTELDTRMDLSSTIAQGVPLRLQELLDADTFNFAHDIGGIFRHLNRRTGKLEDFFRPRFAK